MAENIKSNKVWQKEDNQTLNPLVEAYEVGKDYLIDSKLLKYELASTKAHAKMLNKIGILSKDELDKIDLELNNIYKEYGNEIPLTIQDEDIHSKIENILTSKLGDLGKKIHTGRSRNDQVLVVLRLYEKEKLYEISSSLIELLEILIEFAKKNGNIILPGYTHTKQAMLINVKTWITAFIESGIDNLKILKNVIDLIDTNPLGTASGFGVPLPLDRKMTTELLGFKKIQINPVYVQNSRGKFESLIIDTLWCIMNDFSRIASDMLIFNMDELMFLKTNNAITTGSSIMPQKRNLDVMELVRARTNTVLSHSFLIKNIISGLISGYNRDLQETKAPLMESFDIVKNTIDVLKIVFQNINFDEKSIKAKLSKGIFATDIVFQKVKGGMSFRDAYKIVAKNIEEIKIDNTIIKNSINNRISLGSPKTLKLSFYAKCIKNVKNKINKDYKLFSNKLTSLLN